MHNDEYWQYLNNWIEKAYPTKEEIVMTNTYGWDNEFKVGDKVEFFGLKGVVNGDLEVDYFWQVPVDLKKANGRLVILNSELLTKR